MSSSNYKALAIRYRPRTFDEIVGHDSVKKAFVNAIQSNRIHHAFLLTGTRGVGKTTVARILALSLNCASVDAPTVHPCLECSNCTQIMSGSHPDVIEFDAASKTGIDSIREVIDSSVYAPIMSRYKVYIIDEVHMLSKGAFNALLKTVEEPVDRVKFIFATTELRKVPITIMSRCQKFILGNLSRDEIKDHLVSVSQKEGYEIEDEAVMTIAKYANGSVRDALSLLDQVISVSDGKKIIVADVTNALSMPEFQGIVELFDAMMSNDLISALRCSAAISSKTDDVEYVLSTILYIISNLLKSVSGGVAIEDRLILELSEKHKARLTVPLLIRMWEIVSNSMKGVGLVDSGQFLDVLCIKFMHTNQLPTPNEIITAAFGKNPDA